MGVFRQPQFPDEAAGVVVTLDALDAASLLRALRGYGAGDAAAEALIDRLDEVIDAGADPVAITVDAGEFQDIYDAVEFEYARREKDRLGHGPDLLAVIVALGDAPAVAGPDLSL